MIIELQVFQSIYLRMFSWENMYRLNLSPEYILKCGYLTVPMEMHVYSALICCKAENVSAPTWRRYKHEQDLQGFVLLTDTCNMSSSDIWETWITNTGYLLK